MKRFTLAAAAWLLVGASAMAVRAGITNNFSTNPLTDPSVVIQGVGNQTPDAATVASRFTYNGADGTLTAHYDTSKPTIKLEFPLGQHFNQNTSFTVSATLELQSNGLVVPADFSGQVASFGLVNSVTTGSLRASTGDADGNEVLQGTAFDLMTFDYFPAQTFGNDVVLTTLQSPTVPGTFNAHFAGFNFTESPLPTDQFFTVAFTYDANTKNVHFTWNGQSLDADLTGAVFNTDSFAIALWSDPGLTATAPAIPFGEPAVANVVFDSFSVQAVPEPASLGLLAIGSLILMRRRKA